MHLQQLDKVMMTFWGTGVAEMHMLAQRIVSGVLMHIETSKIVMKMSWLSSFWLI
jgi:hypothetical protein